MQKLTNIIKEKGRTIPMTVNTPFLNNDPTKVWFVAEGNVNIYTVQLNTEKSPEGKRFYFCTIKKGKIFLGMNSEKSGTNVSFSADASEESLLYELDIDILKSLCQEDAYQADITSLITGWLENVWHGISENANHPSVQADVLVKAGERLILRQGENIASQRRLIWAKISASKLDAILINGSGKVSTEAKELLIPITRRSFLQSERNVGMRFFDTKEALMQQSAWEGLHALDKTIFELEEAEIKIVKAQEEVRLRNKYENQFKKTTQSLKETQSILNKKEADKYAQDIDFIEDKYLFNACQVVASQSEIQLTAPLEDNEFDPLGDIARASKVRYREVLLDKEWWKKDSGAILGFLEGEEDVPLALMPISTTKYEAYNPKTEETFEVNEETASTIDKVAYNFFKPFPEEKLSLWDILRFGIFKDWKEIYLIITLGIGATVLGLIVPIMTGLIFDYVIPTADENQVLMVGGALFVAMLAYILFEFTENYALLRLESKMDMRLQAAVWDRLLNLPASFFRQFTTGDLADRSMGINEIRQMLSGVVVSTILGSLFSFLNFFLLFYYSVTLALAALALALLEIFIIFILGRWQVSKEKKATFWQGQTQGIVLQLLTGIAKFRVTGTEIRAFRHWLDAFNQMKRHRFEASQIQNIQNNLNAVMPIISTAVIYAVLLYSSVLETLSTGEFLAFSATYAIFTASLLSMSAALLTIYQAFPIYNRTKPILETLPESDSFKSNPGKLKGNIEVSQVSFRYGESSPLVLQDISLRLNAGDYVAFVGPSGSGKSTLVRLLLGFEKPESGSVFYDNQDLGQLDLRLVRRQIGTVLQDGQLTPGDIFSNIVGSSPQLTLDDAWEAAKLAAFDEDIKRMPMGMHTVINEGSSTLSGGQKQRLQIAQTLVHKPRVVIFDEATSALDNQTQAVITQSLNKLQATRIVIAHRLSTIKDVDKIFVFDKGRLVQAGTYQDLMAVEGLFKDLAKRQMG